MEVDFIFILLLAALSVDRILYLAWCSFLVCVVLAIGVFIGVFDLSRAAWFLAVKWAA